MHSAQAAFLSNVESTRPQLKTHAEHLRDDILTALLLEDLAIHAVTSRVKARASLASKLREKVYSDPARELTDIVGIRVITYFEDHIEPATAALKSRLKCIPEHSSDKRDILRAAEFGYRSVHLVAEFPEPALASADHRPTVQRFEIQIRSILQHAWAEIEHEVKYKSGINFPDTTNRRFSALAGSLEILDREFVNIRRAQNDLVADYLTEYQKTKGGEKNLDSARLIAAMEANRPEAQGWRRRRGNLEWFDFQDARMWVRALGATGLNSWNALNGKIEGQPVRDLLQDYAAATGTTEEQVGHRVVAAMAALATDREIGLRFPELLEIDHVQSVVDDVYSPKPRKPAPTHTAKKSPSNSSRTNAKPRKAPKRDGRR